MAMGIDRRFAASLPGGSTAQRKAGACRRPVLLTLRRGAILDGNDAGGAGAEMVLRWISCWLGVGLLALASARVRRTARTRIAAGMGRGDRCSDGQRPEKGVSENDQRNGPSSESGGVIDCFQERSLVLQVIQ